MNVSRFSACLVFGIGMALHLAGPALAQREPSAIATVGRSISVVLDELRAGGLPFAYGTTLVPLSLTVVSEPRATDPIEFVREILQPHGLTLRWAGGLYLVVRAERREEVATLGTAIVTLRDAASGMLIGSPGVASESDGLRVEPIEGGRLRLTGRADRRYGATFTAVGFAPRRESIRLAATSVDLSVELTPLIVAIPEIVVSASRYEILREVVNACGGTATRLR
jgi:hypothetical protein